MVHHTPVRRPDHVSFQLRLKLAVYLATSLVWSCIFGVTSAHAIERESSAATIQGTISYEFDPQRRWRYWRYYIRDQKSGRLSEAVVSLDMRGRDVAERDGKITTHVIDQKDHAFAPETTVARAGDKIRFTNSDPGVHNVFADRPPYRFSFNLGQGNEVVREFERHVSARRPVELGCKLHASMRAWVYVFNHPYYSMTKEDGRFRFEQVPPGEHELLVAHPAGGLWRTERLSLEPGKTYDVNIRLSPDHRLD